MLERVFELLQWEGTELGAREFAEAEYASFVAERLGSYLRGQDGVDSSSSDAIVQGLSKCAPKALRNVLLAPETTCRLLWGHPGQCDSRSFLTYLVNVIRAEEVLCNAPLPDRDGFNDDWSALGVPLEDGSAPTAGLTLVGGGLSLDMVSPFSVCFDYSGMVGAGLKLVRYERDSDDSVRAAAMVGSGMAGIQEVGPHVLSFVQQFTLTANVVRDTANCKFTSGSSGQYIGRSLICNAHLPFVDNATVAEAIVHEAVHSLLYMHEVREPWVLNPELSGSRVVVESPWTGSQLPLRPFLQACFVWFALAHFWRLADVPSFPAVRKEECLGTTLRGFAGHRLVDLIAGQRSYVAPLILEHIDAMQDHILRV